MQYTAKIAGTYKSKIYIDLIFFKIVRGWRTDSFSYSQVVNAPDFHEAFQPLKNVPIALALDVTPTGADISLQLLNESFPIEHFAFPSSGSMPINWQPLKGVVIAATASLTPIVPAPDPTPAPLPKPAVQAPAPAVAMPPVQQ